jgi:propionyl-CoA synthetase
MHYSTDYKESIENKTDFWKRQASKLFWKKFPNTILNSKNENSYEWFSGGITNMSFLCIDTQIEQGRGHQTAIIYDSPVTNTIQKISYFELKEEVENLAGVLQHKGLQKDDTCIIYMPMIPQAVFSMLACARLGVIHSVVFGGFAPHELTLRIDDAKPKMIISADYGIEFDKKIFYKPLLDEAIEMAENKPLHCLIFHRDHSNVVLNNKIDLDYVLEVSKKYSSSIEWLPSSHPLYILYTSGTTGKPKGIVRDTGGYATALKYTMDQVYNSEAGDIFWAASDVGWVVGHSYIVYGPLLQGCTTVLFEGKPIRTPDAGTFWRVCEQHQVKTMFTAPTAIRAIKKEDFEGVLLKKYDLSNLKYLFLAGERCDPATFEWAKNMLSKPVIDHWWQTESGWPMLALEMSNPLAPEPKAGSSNFPVSGFEVNILDDEGNVQNANQEGFVAIKLPLPPGCLVALWNQPHGFEQSYLSQFKGYYLAGDGGYYDDEGYFYIMGRIDDVINVAGHRLSTGEMEEILAAHSDIAECAVVGIDDALRGQRPIGFVVLKDQVEKSLEQIQDETIQQIRGQIGAIAYYRNTVVVKRLPKTRSGKILRKNLRMLADSVEFSIPSTIDDPIILDEIKQALDFQKIGKKFDV